MRLPRRSPLVTVGLGALALVVGACRPATTPPSERKALAEAVGSNLPFQSRLSGGFVPSTQRVTRSAGDGARELSPDTRIAIAVLEKRASASPSPEAQADLGVAYLVQGDVDRAITTLEDAASQLNMPASWSDLSAAYLAKGERIPSRKVEMLSHALEAAEKSLKLARTNDALFNRALARDGLTQYVGATAPWPEYTAAESDPKWKEAASRHAANRRPSDDARDQWAARRKKLAERLNAGDKAFVNETVGLFPEASIDYLEQELLVDEHSLKSAELLGAAIYEITRDPMMRDEVAVLRTHGNTIARGHRAYQQALRQFDANDRSGARRSLAAALADFSNARAPYELWVRTRVAVIDWRDGRFDVTQSALAAVEHAARQRQYSTLLGTVKSHRGLTYLRQWALTPALASFRESASVHEAAGERDYATRAYSNLADALRILGETHESWEFIGRTLEELPRLRSPLRRYLLLYNAALFASRQELYESALLFEDAAAQQAKQAGADVLTEATIQRALVHVRRGDLARARADFESAKQRVADTPEGSFRDYQRAELNILKAQLGSDDQGEVAALDQAISFFSRIEPGRVPALYLLLSRRPQIRASRAASETALRSGIDALESQLSAVGEEALRISYFDESWTLFQEMVSLQVAARDQAKTFEYAERSRARSLLSAAQRSTGSRTRPLVDVQSQIPPSTVLVHYSTLADRILIWTITPSAAAFVERPIEERDLSRLIEQHRAAIREGRDDRDVNDRLFSMLVQPALPAMQAVSTVVLIPDGKLQQLPFATLRNPATGRYLVEDHPLLISPSASFFIDARAAARPLSSAPILSALLVGNPSADGVRALPGAEVEVADAARLYSDHELLIGRDATRERFVQAAPSFDIVHFGGHALVNPEFPLLSRLVFAGGANEQSLFAHEIARIRFPRTQVVVLAACSTASGPVSRGEGVLGVARPFLAGGVPLVIASQWDVDDQATQQLMLAFHRELTRSRNPIHALQAAQLSLLRSADGALAMPKSWGAFVAVGTTAR